MPRPLAIEILDAIGARPAPAHVTLHQNLFVDRQLVIEESLEALAGVLAANVGSHA